MLKLTIILSSLLCFINSACATGAERIVIGNRLGEVQFGEGPGEFMIEQRACRYALSLGDGWHVKFNDPDAIFYFSEKRISRNNLPYLSQGELQSGYDWSFKKLGRSNDRWFGVMCENKANFTWGASTLEYAPQLTQTLEANSQKCPAIFKNGRWELPHPIRSMVVFRELRGADWAGFVMGFNGRTTTTSLNVIRFCIIHDEDVIIGAMENGAAPLKVSQLFVNQVVEILSTIKFFSRDGDSK